MFNRKRSYFYNGLCFTVILLIWIVLLNFFENEFSFDVYSGLLTFSFAQHSNQRLSVLNNYKRKIAETSKRIQRIKKSLSKLKSLPKENESNLESTFESVFDFSPTHSNGKVDRTLVTTVISLMKEQVKFLNLLMKRLVIFWDPSYNFGVDISSNGPMDSCFLDMLGLGDKSIWEGSSYGGKLFKAMDTEMDDHISIHKLIDLIQICRYSMVYHYLLIIGSIYRRNKNFERIVRSRFRLFKNVREKLISSRDSLALLLNTDLPDDVLLPFPITPPCYLDIEVNCNQDVYNSISKEIAFFKGIQDENKSLSVKIRDVKCKNHDYVGCSSCELRKISISIIEWSINDLQHDIVRLEKDSKLCLSSMNKSKESNFLGDRLFHSSFTKSREVGKRTDLSISGMGDYQDVDTNIRYQELSGINFNSENSNSISDNFTEVGHLSSNNSTDLEVSNSRLESNRSSVKYIETKRYKRRSAFSKSKGRSSRRSSRSRRARSRRSKSDKLRQSESEISSSKDDLDGDLSSNNETASDQNLEFDRSTCSSESEELTSLSDASEVIESELDEISSLLRNSSFKNSEFIQSSNSENSISTQNPSSTDDSNLSKLVNEISYDNSLSQYTSSTELNLNDSSEQNRVIPKKRRKKHRLV